MEYPAENLTMGVFARLAGVNVETIRFCQRKGLLHEPHRPQAGIRRDKPSDLVRVQFVKTAQWLGFSLDESVGLSVLEDGAHCD